MTIAGSTVQGGFYFDRDHFHLVTVSGKTGVLPGKQGERYWRIPVLAMLVLAPVLGGLFVMFLPFIGFALVFHHLARLSLSGMKRAVHGLLGIVTPTWRPGEAYFAGKEGEKQDAKDAKAAKDVKAADKDAPQGK